MEIITKKRLEELQVYQRRIEILVGARLRQTEHLTAATRTQDAIRKKVKSWSGVDEIRKWRLQHH